MDRFTLGFLKNQSGNNVIINNAMNKPLFQLGGDGTSEQVVTTGANLFENKYETQTKNGITLTKNEDGTITLNGTCSSSEIYNDFNLIDLFSYSGENIASVEVISGSATGLVEWQLTDNNWENVLFMGIQNNINPNSQRFAEGITYTRSTLRVANNCVCNNLKFGLQIQNGTEVKPYEPYTNGVASPSPDYEQPINSIEGSLEFACRGKNLLPNVATSKTINGINFTVNKDKSVTLNGTATAQTDFPFLSEKLNLDGEYTFSISDIGQTGVTIQYGISGIGIMDTGTATTKFTTTFPNKSLKNEYSYIDMCRVRVASGTICNNYTIYPMIRKGTQATEYEPYVQPNEVTFNLNDEKLRSVGDVKDELVVDMATGDYYKVENIGEVILDGSENYLVDDTKEYKRLQITKTANNVKYAQKLCNYATYNASGSCAATVNNAFDLINNYVYITMDKTIDAETFMNSLSLNNMIIDYQLTTPTTKKLGTLSAEDLAKLKTFYGYNNITVNTNLGLMNINLIYFSHTN